MDIVGSLTLISASTKGNIVGAKISLKRNMGVWKRSLLMLDSPYESGDFSQSLMMRNEFHQGQKFVVKTIALCAESANAPVPH
jgi:hypothetical protein